MYIQINCANVFYKMFGFNYKLTSDIYENNFGLLSKKIFLNR